MPAIMPVSSLRTYSDVLESVSPGSPVFLTRNGHGRYAILDMVDYDKMTSESRLFSELDAGRKSGELGGWLSSEAVRAHFESRSTRGL